MIITNSKYWDCECKNNYIHLKEDRVVCPVCKAEENDGQPDSRVNELIEENLYNNTTEQKPESKLRLSNSQFIALSCELAHERVKEGHWKYGDGDSNRDYITEKDGEGCYTKSGQVYFDSLYDHYQGILNKYIDGQEPE